MILILGGTAEGRRLAAALPGATVSLAGRTASPRTEGAARVGGFGGVRGLVHYLDAHGVDAVLDATHPFAATMTHNATLACAQAGVPLLRVERPSWTHHADASGWTWVADHCEAARAAAEGKVVFLTVGRQHTVDYVDALHGHCVVARVAEAPDVQFPPLWEVLPARGPFTLDDERDLFTRHGFDTMVTKDSGGPHTDAKLHAARETGATVVMIRRPTPPPGLVTVGSVDEALAWVSHHSS